MTLMGRKMAACAAVSGRFSMEGLAAMAGDDEGLEMAMARALVDKTAVAGEAIRAWERIITPNGSRVIEATTATVHATPLSLFDDMPWFEGA